MKAKKYKATRDLHHGQLGRLKKGSQFEATDAQLSGIRNFVTEVYDTKVTREAPAGEDTGGRKSGKQSK